MYSPFAPPPWFALIWYAMAMAAAVATATATAVVARRFRYGGMPRPAEWLALLIAAVMIVLAMPELDGLVNRAAVAFGLRDRLDDGLFGPLRWAWAGVGLAVVLAGLAPSLVPAGRRRLPAGVRTLALVVAAAAWFWGPSAVARMELPWLIHNPAPEDWSWGRPSFDLWLAIRKGIGRIPGDLLFGVPVVATVRRRLRTPRPGWRWTEWAGAGSMAWLGLSNGLIWLLFGLGAPRADRLVEPLTVAAVLLLSLPIAGRLDPAAGGSLPDPPPGRDGVPGAAPVG